MPTDRKPSISPRKKPRQARSTQLVDDVLEAAIRVLLRDGERGFTTARVAEEAGVSVGSLYQYFPNKAALLFRLQADEWKDTWEIVESVLTSRTKAPRERLAEATVIFFRSEREELPLRTALEAAVRALDDHPDAVAHLERAHGTLMAFAAEVAPLSPPVRRARVAEIVMTSLAALGERLSRRSYTRAEVDTWARECADMHWSAFVALRETLE